MANKQKLELTWIGKEKRSKLEPRILLEDPKLSYHAEHRVTGNDIFDNRLIFGDNLLALKALEQDCTGKVRCVYIDPPFNTQQAFEHYDDGVEHSLWLSLMRERLTVLHSLLSATGSIFIHIDDNELGYLIALSDEIFGRSNRISIITFKQGAATGHKSINPGCVTNTNFVLWYAKSRSDWEPGRVYTKKGRDKRYNQFIINRELPIDDWRIVPLRHAFASSVGLEPGALKSLPDLDRKLDAFVFENAEAVVQFARPSYSAVSREARELIDRSKESPEEIFFLPRDDYSDMYFLKGQRIIFFSDTLKRIDGELVPGDPLTTLWDDIPSNNLHKEGGVDFPKGKKPEALIKRCLELATNPNDLVLDSFAGSGTTGAVAHKMGRRWIMVELGEQCRTHIVPRLKSVISGADQDGVSKALGWPGGGGFRYHKLAPSLLEKDKWDNWVINMDYNANMLSEALCKLEGFTYAPSDSVYWQHGYSTESDFVYVTTASLNHEQLQELSDEVGEDRSLLVLCTAFRAKRDQYPNLTIKKIPSQVLSRCEWGHDDYSLQVENLPQAEPALYKGPGQQGLFEGEGELDQ